jgi:G3E family GTPase
MKTRIIFAGGFLGAGKTTLLLKAGQMIASKGVRAGLITNDQAPELVDTALLRSEGMAVAEVSGSCFCCNYNGFIAAAQNMRRNAGAEIILAEPVGSCTDLSATIVQPLKQFGLNDFEAAPLSVLADPARLEDIINGSSSGLHPDAAYIYRKQLEESDIIIISKTDAYPPETIERLSRRSAELFPAKILRVSSLSGDGLEAWLNEVMKPNRAGMRIAEVDYDRYAHGEAVMGWLNGRVVLHGETADWNRMANNLMAALAERFDGGNMPVGHIKIIVENGNQYIAGNLTGNNGLISLRGSVDDCATVRITINARVETSPGNLDQAVRDTLERVTAGNCSMQTVAWRFLMPGRPQPTHRFAAIV